MSVPAAYLGVILIWSTTPLAIQWSAHGASFSFALMSRMLIGLILCLLLLRATRTAFPLTPAARQLYAISGLTLSASMLLVYWGALHIPSGLISVIFGLSPLVTGVFAALWLSERTLTPMRLMGIGIALLGLWFIFGQPWPGDDTLATIGTLTVVIGMMTQALGLVWIKRFNVRASSLAITAGSLSVAVPCFVLAWAIADSARLPDITPRAGAAIVYLGVLGSVVGFTLYYYIIKHLDAGRVALIMLITPVAALLLGQTLNAEFIPAMGWAGIALIGSGLVMYEWRALRSLRSPRPTADNGLPSNSHD